MEKKIVGIREKSLGPNVEPGKGHASNHKKVVNLSSHTLTDIESSILKKGLNFALSPRSIPTETIICNIEDCIQNLNALDKETVRQDCALVLRRAKIPKNNVTKEEQLTLRSLKSNNDIVILKADKGGATVILDKEAYNAKMLDHLTTGGSYRKLNKNPISN